MLYLAILRAIPVIKVTLMPDLQTSLLNRVMMLLGGICLVLLSAFDNLASDSGDKRFGK